VFLYSTVLMNKLGGSNCIDCKDDKYNSLRYKKCEPFTMKYEFLFIEIFFSNCLHRPRHGYPVIVVVSSFHRRLINGGGGWLRVPHGANMVVRGSYLLSHRGFCLNSSSEQLSFLTRASPMGYGAFFCLSRQVSLLNYMG
jgi:hypothetical protein